MLYRVRSTRKAIDQDEITALYAWAPGSCFRCAAVGADTTKLDVIDTPIGDRYEIRACRRCVIDLEGERRWHAERCETDYAPGGLGAV
ncbi:hypothetical protein [Streptomyces albireticuli]|uniref:Uncharacterized protein n=1 Tax=Streptomyces albireticuli TaxID=1940 RepID=A0A2A2D3R7_9ACTN|nr:hypothetical protein [Streptomyces albireticuli]MCD9196098.1 hypothetical protein [Streptomyces albireticuli]PAU46151.1 hypothetical protein CK936_25480 [Streptomyces albireticuli]